MPAKNKSLTQPREGAKVFATKTIRKGEVIEAARGIIGTEVGIVRDCRNGGNKKVPHFKEK